MRKIIFFSIIVLSTIVIAVASNYAADKDNGFNQVKSELKSSGMSDNDISSIEGTLKDMLRRGVSRDEVINAVHSAQAEGLSGTALVSRLNETMNRHNTAAGANQNMQGDQGSTDQGTGSTMEPTSNTQATQDNTSMGTSNTDVSDQGTTGSMSGQSGASGQTGNSSSSNSSGVSVSSGPGR